MNSQDLFPQKDLHLSKWEPTHRAASARLKSFIPYAGRAYAKGRNFDFGPANRSNVSALSPWIRHRLLLERDVITGTLGHHSFQAAEKFIQEVFWRGYFKGWLQQRPEVWQAYRQNLVAFIDQLEKDSSLASRYEAAVNGQTGIACFDHWANELADTGYLHNHARMWFASIWIYTLKLPWELGADFFYRNLLDGDPASNTCSWRWVGGLHTIGKTYLARAANIEKFTNGRFNPVGQLATEALPQPGACLPDRTPISVETPKLHGQKIGLIITEEDCSPHSLQIAGNIIAAIALDDFTPRSTLASPEHVREFAPNAVRAAADIFSQRRMLEVSSLGSLEWDVALENFTSQHALDVLVTARLPYGPVRRRLLRSVKALSLPLIEVTRAYDAAIWPHAKAGFFGLKKKLPIILGSAAFHHSI